MQPDERMWSYEAGVKAYTKETRCGSVYPVGTGDIEFLFCILEG